MKLAPGMQVTRRYEIDTERTIAFMGDAMRIYATPSMVRDVEVTCKDFLQSHLTDAESSVGARVEIDHLGPTMRGMWVDVTATVAAIEGRRVVFDVEVKDAIDLVGRAKHVRFVVELAKQKERLEAKAAKLAAKGTP